jgi:hypothetical protein
MRPSKEIYAELLEWTEKTRALREEYDSALVSEAGVNISVGDRVRAIVGRNAGTVYLVTNVRPWGGGSVSLDGKKIKKDGNPHARNCWIGTSGEVEKCYE